MPVLYYIEIAVKCEVMIVRQQLVLFTFGISGRGPIWPDLKKTAGFRPGPGPDMTSGATLIYTQHTTFIVLKFLTITPNRLSQTSQSISRV